jgi:hypothetical protein
VTFEDWAWNDAYARCAARRDAGAIAWLKHSFLEAALSRLVISTNPRTPKILGR